MRYIGVTKGGVRGSYTAPPTNPINVFLMAGQSNADEGTAGQAVTLMAAAGISNPAFHENFQSGTGFNAWYTSSGFAYLASDGEIGSTTDVEVAVDSTAPTAIGTRVTLTANTGTPFSGYKNGGMVLLSDFGDAEYNGYFPIFNVVSGSVLQVTVRDTPPATTTGGTVRRAGFRETFKDYCEQLAADGSYVNVIGMGFMQGEGNVTTAGNGANWQYGRAFVKETYEWVLGDLSNATRTTIDRNFVIAIGLTAIEPTNLGDPTDYDVAEATAVRNYQKGCGDRRDYCYWFETLQLDRSADGKHCDPADMYPLMLKAITENRNVRGNE